MTSARRKPAPEDRMPPESEASLLAKVTATARLYGFFVAHTHDSRHSESGVPDLLMVHRTTGRLIFAELKKDDGVVETPEQRWRDGKAGLSQQEWLDALALSKAEVYVWRPRDWDDIERRLEGAAVGRRHRKARRLLGPSQQVIATLLQAAGHPLTVAELTETIFSRQLITSINEREGVRTAIASTLFRMRAGGYVSLNRMTHRYSLVERTLAPTVEPDNL